MRLSMELLQKLQGFFKLYGTLRGFHFISSSSSSSAEVRGKAKDADKWRKKFKEKPERVEAAGTYFHL